ncbi:FhaA domain-containing protein [Changpingibacter yushuensis]|uniref:FhaA domain-containing protein n=1 Tax=Changpingibacter yushuensis TaxID=2758440 RepID=UPI0015F5AB6A|nr:DUF3662 and FHA domain-containing protein [Changpingibacter yushuensis]
MGAFDKFEKGVENAVANAFSRAFKSELKPVEIASALKKALDEHAATVSRERTVSPNDFLVTLAPSDLENVEQWGRAAFADEMVNVITDYATEQDFAFLGPVRVQFTENPAAKSGSIQVAATTVRGAVAPVTSSATSGHYPMLEIGSSKYLLTGAVTVVGRGSDCDIPVEDTGVSRHHFELRVTPSGVIATDLGSTNGTFVEGHRITAATLLDGNTITIGRTHIMFWNASEAA